MKSKEAIMSKDILDRVKAMGGYGFKIHIDMMQQPGIPDMWIQYGAKSAWIEIKDNSGTTKEGRPTDIQFMVMRKIQSAGGTAFCARCWDDVNAFLCGEMIVNYEILYPGKQELYASYGYVKTQNKWDEYIKNVYMGAYLPKEIDL